MEARFKNINKKSSVGHIETKYFWDSNDKVIPLSSKKAPLRQHNNKPLVHDVHNFNAVNYHREKWHTRDHKLPPKTNS